MNAEPLSRFESLNSAIWQLCEPVYLRGGAAASALHRRLVIPLRQKNLALAVAAAARRPRHLLAVRRRHRQTVEAVREYVIRTGSFVPATSTMKTSKFSKPSLFEANSRYSPDG